MWPCLTPTTMATWTCSWSMTDRTNLLSNNLDGTFRPLAQEQGLTGQGGPSRQIVAWDLDRDRDLDLLVINDQPPHEVYRNDRLWSYEPAEGFDRSETGPVDGRVWPWTATATVNGSWPRWSTNDLRFGTRRPTEHGEHALRRQGRTSGSSIRRSPPAMSTATAGRKWSPAMHRAGWSATVATRN